MLFRSQYGSGSDSDDQPSSGQYSYKDVAKEAAYELLSKDDVLRSKRRESDKIRDREYLSEIYEDGDLDGMESLINSDDEEEDQKAPSESISSYGAEDLSAQFKHMSKQLKELIRKQEEQNSRKRARNDTYAPDRKKSRKQQHAYDAPLKSTV